MKLTAAILLWLISSFSIQAQNPNKQHFLNVYKRAIKYNDIRTAISSIQNYLAIDDEIRYKDTLGTLYLLAADYYSSLLISKEVLDVEKTNLSALERVAECYNQLGDLKSAVEHYEKLAVATKNANHYYKLAEAQYQLKRIAECGQNLQMVIADTNSKHIPTPFSIGGGKAQKCTHPGCCL
jgi:tetratricopeptide (TPR) repeat protein